MLGSNEGDNVYMKTITVTTSGGGGQPNLAPYLPAGWSDKIVVSKTTGTRTDSTGLTTADTLYLDWSVINAGSAATTAYYKPTLLLYSPVHFTSFTDPPLSSNFFVTVDDYSLGTLSAGTHTLRVKTDSTSAIWESDEGDDEYTRTITVTTSGGGGQPNLAPYLPAGWSDKIVVSKTTGT